MDELFYTINFSQVIKLTDDIKIANDFFEYFEFATALLNNDKSMLAISSWSDYRCPKRMKRWVSILVYLLEK